MDADPPEASTSYGTRTRVVAESDGAMHDKVESYNAKLRIARLRAGGAGGEAKEFNHQYANIYYMRLAVLKPRVLQTAARLWHDSDKLEEPARHVDRVLEVKTGELCYLVGTIYIEMKLKPNVLEDLAREFHLVAPPPVEKYITKGEDEVMLEDESGRVRLIGKGITDRKWAFVTGIIVGVLGAETRSGDFEVLDICYAGLPDQLPRTLSLKSEAGDEAEAWVALASGLELGGKLDADDVSAALLAEFLTGELVDDDARSGASRISRLILAGDSMRTPVPKEDVNKTKRYGYDASLYSSRPTASFTSFLLDVVPSLDVDVMPGDEDPTGPTLPQQPLHPALLYEASKHEGLSFSSNPAWFEHGGITLLGTSGQTLDDAYKYIDGTDRLDMARLTLEWSHIAPSAPDTLWCHPYAATDPFLLRTTPHVYFIGNQPSFGTTMIEGNDGQRVRIILVPRFSRTGELVLVNTRTLDVRVVQIVAR